MDEGQAEEAPPAGHGLVAQLKTHAVPCALIVLAGLLVFGRAIFFDFVHYDDWGLLVLHADALADPLYALSSFWTDAFAILSPDARGVFYRPVLMLTYGLEAQILGPHPLLYHVTNVSLHLLVSCLVYFFLLAFDVRRRLAVALALVFACHPAAAMVAAWIPGRNDALLAIWFLIGAIGMLRFMRDGAPLALAGALSCYAGALFTKEPGGVLVGLLVAIPLLELPVRPERRRPLLIAAGVAVGITLSWAVLRSIALGASPIGASRIPENVSAVIVYVGKALFPVNFSVVPHAPDTSLVPGLIALGLLAVVAASNWRRLWGPAGLGLLWFGAALAPVLLAPAQTWGLEQRLYVPLAGLLLFLSQVELPGRPRLPAWCSPALALVVAIVFGVQAARRLPDFANGTAFWESAAASAPNSALAASRVAWQHYEARRFPEMHRAIERTLALDPNDGQMYLLRGIAAGNAGDRSGAERHFLRAVELAPDFPDAWENLGKLRKLQGRHEESRTLLEKAEALRRR